MQIFGHRLNLSAWIGLAIVVINLLAALLAPVIAPYGQAELVGDVWAPPSGLGNHANLRRDPLYGSRRTAETNV